MAFEPRIVRSDDHDEAPPGTDPRQSDRLPLSAEIDGWLPDDLQELASQLSADSARLAASFPAEPPALDGLRRRRHRWRPTVAAAAVVAALGLAVLGHWGFAPRRADQSPLAIQPVGAAKSVDLPLPTPEAAISPAFLLENLTGPEREGVLDLLEQQMLPAESVSI